MRDPNTKPAIAMQSIIDAQDNPFVLIDEKYRIVGANKAYCDAYGIPQDQVVGHTCHQVSHHSAVPCHQNGEDCPHKHVFETGEPHEVLHIHYDQYDRAEHVRIKGAPVVGSNGEKYLGESVHRLAQPEELDCEDLKLVGKSQAFLACLEEVTRAAESDAAVLLFGESGVGKDLAAKYIHKRSGQKGHPFITVDCATIGEAMFERELFGHERGAFSGCVGRRHGLFEAADRGILFLDEIAEIPLSVQGRLMRALETGEFRRVGGRDMLTADVRIVSATHRDLRGMVELGTFRADLYYRIAGITIDVPPLRDRREDIPAIADVLLDRLCDPRKMHCHLREDALDRLSTHDFPGNIRELRNILQKASSLSTNGIITADQIRFDDTPAPARLAKAVGGNAAGKGSDLPSMQGMEATYIANLLEQHDGHRAKVAGVLGISERTLYRKLKRFGLEKTGLHS